MSRLLAFVFLLIFIHELYAQDELEKITFDLVKFLDIREIIWVWKNITSDCSLVQVKFFSLEKIPIVVVSDADLLKLFENGFHPNISTVIVFRVGSLVIIKNFLKLVQNMKKHHYVSEFAWFIYLENNELLEELTDLPVPYNSEFIIIRKISENEFELTEFYTVNQAIFKVNLATWSSNLGLQATNKSFYERRENLKNVTLTYAREPLGRRPCKGGGYISCAKRELLEDVQRLIKFELKIVQKTRERDDGPEYADIYDSRSMIHSSSFDFDVFGPLYKLELNWYIKDPTLQARDDFFLLPFAPDLWLSILLTIIGGSFIIIAIGLFTNHEKRSLLTDNLFLTLDCFSNQDGGESRSSTSFRIALITIRIVALFIIPSYSAVIISFLAARLPRLPFRTLEEFAANGKYFMIRNEGASFPQQFFESSADATAQLINRKYMKALSEQEGMKTACSGGHAIIAPNIFRKNPPCKYYQIENPLTYAFTGLSLSKHSPFRATFNHNLIRINSSGIQSRMQEKIDDVPLKDLSVEKFLPVTFSQMQLVFSLIPLAIGITIIFYVLELIFRIFRRIQLRYRLVRCKSKCQSVALFSTKYYE